MSSIVPPSAPRLSGDAVRGLLRQHLVQDAVAIVGVRGYYCKTMGDPMRNDRGIYDDAIFIVGPDHFSAYNANVDPSIYRKHVATLKPGLWRYRVGIHGLSKPKPMQYVAMVQEEPVTVTRDNEPEETGWFGINIHRGGDSGTSSLGCQTIIPAQWQAFISAVRDQLARARQRTVPYLLLDGLNA